MSLPIFNFTKIESTNDFARSLITEHKIFKGIVIADEQTKGRGRYGNKWSSPKGNLYFTIFFPILRSNLKKIQFLVQLQIRNILKNYNINFFISRNSSACRIFCKILYFHGNHSAENLLSCSCRTIIRCDRSILLSSNY